MMDWWFDLPLCAQVYFIIGAISFVFLMVISFLALGRKVK